MKIEAKDDDSIEDSAETREQRRASRGAWPIRHFRLGDEPSDDLSDQTTASERFAMVWELSVRAWRLAGRAIPDYERRNMPGAIVRLSDSD